MLAKGTLAMDDIQLVTSWSRRLGDGKQASVQLLRAMGDDRQTALKRLQPYRLQRATCHCQRGRRPKLKDEELISVWTRIPMIAAGGPLQIMLASAP